MIWDTFGLFEALLGDFAAALGEADVLPEGEKQPEGLSLAMVGFCRYRPLGEWHDELGRWLLSRLETDWSADQLSWYGRHGPAVVAFRCLALGALQGKFRAGEIDDAGFLLGDAHLAAFILMRMEDMAAAYEAARGAEPELPSPA
jgi:hypothetical protein